MMRKVGWTYKCETKNPLLYEDGSLICDMAVSKAKKYAEEILGGECQCGKNCKIVKVEIIVREI